MSSLVIFLHFAKLISGILCLSKRMICSQRKKLQLEIEKLFLRIISHFTLGFCQGWKSWWRCRRLHICSEPYHRQHICAQTCSPTESHQERRKFEPEIISDWWYLYTTFSVRDVKVKVTVAIPGSIWMIWPNLKYQIYWNCKYFPQFKRGAKHFQYQRKHFPNPNQYFNFERKLWFKGLLWTILKLIKIKLEQTPSA